MKRHHPALDQDAAPVRRYQVVVIGASAGGSAALIQILSVLPPTYLLPVVVVQHLHPLQDGAAMLYQLQCCSLHVQEAEEKQPLCPGYVYFAPPNYHLLIEDDHTFALSIDEKVNFTRPAIDVLFESASEVYGQRLVGIVLSGANQDGAAGLSTIKRRGGLAIVQDPSTAEVPYMPRAALAATQVDYMLPSDQIGELLIEIAEYVENTSPSPGGAFYPLAGGNP